MIAVMVILAVILAMAAPDLRTFSRGQQASHAARHLLAMAQHCRLHAVSEGREYRLHVDPESASYWISSYSNGGFVSVADSAGRRYDLPKTVSVAWYENPDSDTTDQSSHLRFMPNGLNQTTTIQVTGQGGETWFVTCASPTEPFRIVKSEEDLER